MSEKTWEESADGKYIILYDGEKTYEVYGGSVNRVTPTGRPNYRIGNDQILEKMKGLYGNPKGCMTGEAPNAR